MQPEEEYSDLMGWVLPYDRNSFTRKKKKT